MQLPTSINIGGWWVGVLTYAFCQIAHIWVWRNKKVEREVTTIFLTFVMLPSSAYLFALILFGICALPAFLVHFVLAANYIAIYPAVQAVSPTLRMLNLLGQHPLSEEELLFALSDPSLWEDRLQDLVRGGLVTARQGKVSLTARGRRLARLFIGYRTFMGLPLGEG